MKLWLLSSQQAVFYSYHRLGFCTKGRDKDLVIRKEQFWNLHDVMRGFRQGRYPLGRGLWLKISERGVRIENKQVSFQFYGKSWKRYQRDIHWRIHAYLRQSCRSQRRSPRRTRSFFSFRSAVDELRNAASKSAEEEVSSSIEHES